MKTRILLGLTCTCILLATSLAAKTASPPALDALPLAFEANQGQVDPEVRFFAQTADGTAFVTARGPVLAIPTPGGRAAALRIALSGATEDGCLEGQGALPGVVNRFHGSNPAAWRVGIPTYTSVRHVAAYPGIDVVYKDNGRHLQFDFVVAPGAQPRDIRLAFEGAEKVTPREDGSLGVMTAAGEIVQQRPVLYQEVDGQRVQVAGTYALAQSGDVGFTVGAYDTTRELVIDPLVYSTYLGGSGNEPSSRAQVTVALDTSGNAYVAGGTGSFDFPVTQGAYQTVPLGDIANSYDAFVTKYGPTGVVIYSTFLGGTQNDMARRIAIDSDGSAYVVGFTGNPFTPNDFPTTQGAFDTSSDTQDAFVAKLDPTGSMLVYSTFLGGSATAYPAADEQARAIALDAAGNAYVGGWTGSADFPVTAGAFDTSFNGTSEAFVAKLDPWGQNLVYATFLGGSLSSGNGPEGSDTVRGIAVDGAGNAFVAGAAESPDFPTTAGAPDRAIAGRWDAFVTKLNAAGSGLAYSTFIGGRGDDEAFGIAVDASGNAYATGYTTSNNFPLTLGAYDIRYNAQEAFVTKVNAAGTAFVYSTYLGGKGGDGGAGIAVSAAGNATVVGGTSSTDFPTTSNGFDRTSNGNSDVFVTQLNVTGSALVYSTYLGGSLSDDPGGIALETPTRVCVTGSTRSANFPVANAADSTIGGLIDCFVTKLSW